MKKLKALTVMIIMAVLLAACSGSQSEQTTAPETETETAAAETEGEAAKAETEDESAAAEVSDSQDYEMLQGVVEDVSEDGSSFSLLCDDGVTREISVYDIGDVEVDIENGTQIAIACMGKITDDLSGVTLIVALPEQEEWTFQTKTGVTTNNAMSAFGIETDDGETIQFLKDNCPMEEGALSGDEADRVTVTYVVAAEGNFPVYIKASDE